MSGRLAKVKRIWFGQEGATNMIKKIRQFARNESGATAIEYGLIAALVSVAGITALTTMGEALETMFTTVSTELNNAVG